MYKGLKRKSIANYENVESPEKRIEKWLRDYNAVDSDPEYIDNEEAYKKDNMKKKGTQKKSSEIHVHIVV